MKRAVWLACVCMAVASPLSAQSLELRDTLTGHTGWVYSVAFSPDGKTLASRSDDKTIRIWDVSTGKKTAMLAAHGVAENLAFSPDGKILAEGGDFSKVHLWDVSTKKTRATLVGKCGFVKSVTCSPNGKTLASGGFGNVIDLWDVASGKSAGVLRGKGPDATIILSLAFSPDGKTLAAGVGSGRTDTPLDAFVTLFDVGTGKQTAALKGHTEKVESVAFSPDGKILASGSFDGTIRLWDAATSKNIAILSTRPGAVASIAFSPDSRFLASGGYHGTIRLWDVATGHNIAAAEQPDHIALPREEVAFGKNFPRVELPDGNTRPDPKDVAIEKWHTSIIASLAFSPDGKILASGCWDNMVKLWDVTAPPPVASAHP